ncbi:MAG: peptidoglycan DD-metalloendopeptidase family protein [Bacteroidales bacterium]|nr:peptidoglycan DD-metalloendopeptidase family protein [Bacteroidales bacterium]
MNSSIFYFIEVNITILIFWLLYAIWFKKLTFFVLNRFYLLLAPALAFVLPLLRIKFKTINPITGYTHFEFDDLPVLIGQNGILNLTQETQPTSNIEYSIFSWIYFAVLTVFILTMMISILRISILKIKSKKQHHHIHTYYTSNQNIAPFSFLNFIFMPIELQSSKSFKDILRHEHEHVKQWHSIDIIITEIYSAILWYNPIIYFLKKAARLNHEYLADQQSINNTKSDSYLASLYDCISTTSMLRLAHSFNGSIIKKRIVMMTLKKTQKHKMTWYGITLPILISLMFVYNACSESEQNQKEQITKNTSLKLKTNDQNSIPNILPVEQVKITKSFGWGMRKNPFNGKKQMHNGIDFAAKQGSNIYATANGKVALSKMDGKWGNRIILNHSNGYETCYAHMEKLMVNEGDNVKKGDIIGTVGNTGLSTGPHLHYEIIKSGERINPATMIQNLKLNIE